MSIEISLLQSMKYREKFERLAKAVPASALEVRTQVLLRDFGRFFKEFPETNKLEHEQFFLWFKLAHPTLKEDDRAMYDVLLRKVCEADASPDIEAGIMDRLVAADAANRIGDALLKYHEGGEDDLYTVMRAEVDRFEQQINRKVKVPHVNTDIDLILQDDKDDRGLHWRLGCINRVMRPLRGGDFVVLAARPDKGKTTAIASEVTFMAPQLDSVYPGEDREVLWFNNEGPGRRIVQRVYQAALNATVSDLIKMSNAGVIKQEYAKAVGGLDRIKVMDIHDFWSYEVEDILRSHRPGLVIFDMVDNIRFGGELANGGQRTDQMLEAMYQWARLLGVKYNTAIIATSQVSGDGDGMQYPTLTMLKDSKTGKQGAADAIITMGASNDPMYEGSRWIGMTKNKLHREGAPKSCQCEVLFQGDRARLELPPEVQL